MERISDEKIEQIRSQNDIVDVISEYIHLTKRGRNWFGLCPFHGEQTPSFSVSQEKQIFHCFGCGAGGNVITFVRDIEDLSFAESLQKLGGRIGVEVNVNNEVVQSKRSPLEQSLSDMHVLATDYYHHLLLHTVEGEEALNYLLQRGFTKEIIQTYKIGWAMNQRQALSKLLLSKNYSLETIAESGLAIPNNDYTELFDRFRERVMFPLFDDYGHPIGFSGRIIHPGEQEAKYLNSPETALFKKSENLYNVFQARSVIRKQNKAILMEGFMDVLAAERSDVHLSVATMGTALTSSHVKKLKRLTNHLILAYDQDSAGIEATYKSLELLQAESFTVEVASMPDGLDPDETVRQHGKDFFIKTIEKPISAIAFYMHYFRKGKNFQYENDIVQYIHEVLEKMVGRVSSIEKELYINQLSKETNLSKETIDQQYRLLEGKFAKKQKFEPPKPTSNEPQKIQARKWQAIDRAERLLLAYLISDVEVFERLYESHQTDLFVHDNFQAIHIRLIGFYDQNEQADIQKFLESIEDASLRSLILEAEMLEKDPENKSKEISDCLLQIEKHGLQQSLNDLMQKAKEAERSHQFDQAITHMKEVIEVKKKLSSM